MSALAHALVERASNHGMGAHNRLQSPFSLQKPDRKLPGAKSPARNAAADGLSLFTGRKSGCALPE
jgi:hypothetical protein